MVLLSELEEGISLFFNNNFCIFVPEEIVLKNFELTNGNKTISVRKPRLIKPCRLSVSNCKVFLFLGFLPPLTLKTGSKSLNTCNLIKTVIHRRLKSGCNVSAVTASDWKFSFELLKVLNESGFSIYDLAYSTSVLLS